MANRHRGEIDFECDGRSYTLRFSINSLCLLEDAFNKGVLDIANMLSDVTTMRMSTVRTVFWAGMRDFQKDITIERAGEMLSSMTMPVALDLIGKALAASFPDAGGGGDRPQTPVPPVQDGTGQPYSNGGAN